MGIPECLSLKWYFLGGCFDTRLYRDAQADSFVLQKGLVANKVEMVLALEPSN